MRGKQSGGDHAELAPLLITIDAALASGDIDSYLDCVKGAAAESKGLRLQSHLIEALEHRHKSFLDLCVRRRRVATDAFAYVDMLPPNSRLYYLLVLACADVADYPSACKAWEMRSQAGLMPDSFAFRGLISAAGKAGLLNEARAAFRQSQDAGIASTYVSNAYLDACARCHAMDEALAVWRDMGGEGVEANAVTFNTLIAGAAWSQV
jgi:cytochrome c553